MTNANDEKPVELEHRIAQVQASTFVIPKTCEERNCQKRATRAIAFYSDDPAFPLRIKFLCSRGMQKMIDELSEQPGATVEGGE
jgi:hypothetical protein